MAGDWIKMRVDLADDPAVLSIAAFTELDESSVVGRLHKLWSWADKHTLDGTSGLVGMAWIDRYVGHTGFAEAMCHAGWLVADESSFSLPGFEVHMGAGAKKRLLGQERQQRHRARNARVTLPKPFRRAVYTRDNYQCVYCGTQSDKATEETKKSTLSIDHILPAKRGGKNNIENLVTCCRDCNNEKNDRTPEEWGLTPSFLQPGVEYRENQIFVTDERDGGNENVTPREEKRREEKRRGNKFIAPTVEQVAEYCRERKNTINPQQFVDHYEANGWTRGRGTPIKDWKACVRTWESNGFSNNSIAGSAADPRGNMAVRDQLLAEMEQ